MLTWPGTEVAGSPVAEAKPVKPAREQAGRSLDGIYLNCFADVALWVRALGANEADVEDLTQEVFIIVRRKLGQFDGRNLAGFLYRIAERTVRDHRRSAWIRNLFRGPNALPELAAQGTDTVVSIQQRERRKALERILAKMS